MQSSIQNKHTHFYPNGIVVTHSHPVDAEDDQPLNEHEHTQTEIVLFQQLKIDSFTTSVELNIEPGEFYISQKVVIADDENYRCTLLWQPRKRGPPLQSHLVLKTV